MQSSSGVDMRNMMLQDHAGSAVKVIVFGEIALSDDFADGNEVSLFYVTGQPGRGSTQPGSVWFYNDSYIEVLHHSATCSSGAYEEIYLR